MKLASILDIALTAGSIILKNGAETYRTEETIKYICKGYSIEEVESIVTPTSIFISLKDKDNKSLTRVKSIKHRTINLDKISLISDFSYQLQDNEIPYEKAMARLEEISKQNQIYPDLLAISASSIAGGCYVIIMNLSLVNFLTVFLANFIAQLIATKVLFLKKVNFIPYIAAAFTSTSIILLFYNYNLFTNLEVAIIGGILSFVPGVAATNATRDAINGDLISASARLIEVVIISLSLATGVAISLGGFV